MSTLERAIVIAAEAHAGQTDKASAPYILHPLRMMMDLTSAEERIVAVGTASGWPRLCQRAGSCSPGKVDAMKLISFAS
jgi:hypothetical protein